MSKYDIYIQPSYQEGLPRAMIEAMSIGMPCIGSDAGGICELLNRKYIFKKGNYKEIIHLLSSLTENEVKKMSIENLNTSIKFDNQNISKKRSEFYRNSLFGENYNE